MIKILSIILSFFSLMVTTTIEEEKFLENVNNCYNQYNIVVNEETSLGDITVIFGLKDDKYYFSGFFLNDASKNMTLQLIINGKLNTFVVEGSVINAYGIEVEVDDEVTVRIHHESQDVDVYKCLVADEIAKLTNSQLGTGTMDFPENSMETDIIKVITIIIIVFVLLSIIFIGIIVYFYKTRRGRFSSKYVKPIDVVNEYYEEYGNPVEDSKEEIQQVNKQELMDKYFEEYRSGDITEDELNEKLKKLWWSDNEKD